MSGFDLVAPFSGTGGNGATTKAAKARQAQPKRQARAAVARAREAVPQADSLALDATYGPLKTTGTPLKISETPGRVRWLAPRRASTTRRSSSVSSATAATISPGGTPRASSRRIFRTARSSFGRIGSSIEPRGRRCGSSPCGTVPSTRHDLGGCGADPDLPGYGGRAS